MLQPRHAALAGTLLALAACGLYGPIVDPSMRGARSMACGSVAPVPNGDEPQCFAISRVSEGEVRAVLSGAGECAGDYRHATVTGSADGPGELSVAVGGPTAFTAPNRTWRWREGFAGRTFVLREVGTTFQIPGAAIIRHNPGFRLERVCFASY